MLSPLGFDIRLIPDIERFCTINIAYVKTIFYHITFIFIVDESLISEIDFVNVDSSNIGINTEDRIKTGSHHTMLIPLSTRYIYTYRHM